MTSVALSTLSGTADNKFSSDDPYEANVTRPSVGLEQLLHRDHLDADGRDRTLRKREKAEGLVDGLLEKEKEREERERERERSSQAAAAAALLGGSNSNSSSSSSNSNSSTSGGGAAPERGGRK